MPSRNATDGINMWDAAVFVGIVLGLGAMVLFSDEPVSPGFIALAALTFVYVGASVFDVVPNTPCTISRRRFVQRSSSAAYI